MEYKLDWIYKKADNKKCKLCNSKNTTFLLEIENLLKCYHLYKCNDCGSCFYDNFTFPDYHSSDDYTRLQLYIEIGAGIDSLLANLIRLENLEGKKLLEIGSYFGFLLKFASEILKMDVMGIEPGYPGKLGKDILNIPIVNDYFENVDLIDKYDIIYFSEVIEHVSDPSSFLEKVSELLASDGLIVLTTPNSAFVKENSNFPQLISVLSPGYHNILFSEKSLLVLLKNTGLKYIEIITTPTTLIAYASREKFNLKDIKKINFKKRYYIPYLEKLSYLHNNQIKNGALWRLLKEFVNTGEYGKAYKVLNRITSLIKEEYNLDISNTNSIVEVIRNLKTLKEIANETSLIMGGVYYYAGIIYLNELADYRTAINYFNAAFEIFEKLLQINNSFFPEYADLLWRAKYHEGLSYEYLGKTDESKYIFNSIKTNDSNIKVPKDLMITLSEK